MWFPSCTINLSNSYWNSSYLGYSVTNRCRLSSYQRTRFEKFVQKICKKYLIINFWIIFQLKFSRLQTLLIVLLWKLMLNKWFYKIHVKYYCCEVKQHFSDKIIKNHKVLSSLLCGLWKKNPLKLKKVFYFSDNKSLLQPPSDLPWRWW